MGDDIVLPGSDNPSTATSKMKYADRLDTIEGKRIGYVDWGKPNGDQLFEIFEGIYLDEFGVESMHYFKKPSPSSPIPSSVHDEISEWGPDAMVLAIADCGSCNTSIVVDAITFEEQNIPSVQIITDKFLGLNSKISRSKGYDKLPLITIDHPTRYLDQQSMEQIAEDIKWTVEQILTCEDCLPISTETTPA